MRQNRKHASTSVLHAQTITVSSDPVYVTNVAKLIHIKNCTFQCARAHALSSFSVLYCRRCLWSSLFPIEIHFDNHCVCCCFYCSIYNFVFAFTSIDPCRKITVCICFIFPFVWWRWWCCCCSCCRWWCVFFRMYVVVCECVQLENENRWNLSAADKTIDSQLPFCFIKFLQ